MRGISQLGIFHISEVGNCRHLAVDFPIDFEFLRTSSYVYIPVSTGLVLSWVLVTRGAPYSPFYMKKILQSTPNDVGHRSRWAAIRNSWIHRINRRCRGKKVSQRVTELEDADRIIAYLSDFEVESSRKTLQLQLELGRSNLQRSFR